ncbi:extracellular solute-binding protein [Natronospora cellulosivora (SeqCode)]
MYKDTLKVSLMGFSNGSEPYSFLEPRLKGFQEKEEINIEFEFFSWSRAYQSIINSFKTGNSPDIVQLGTTWVSTLAKLAYIKPLAEDIVFKPALANSVNDSCLFQGEQHAVPWTLDTIIMVVRKENLKRLNISTEDLRDWNGFYQVIKDIAKKRKNDKTIPKPMVFSVKPDMDTVHRFSSWFFAANNRYPSVNRDTDSFLYNKEIIALIDYFSKLIEVSGLSINDVDIHPYQLNDDFYSRDTFVFNITISNGVMENIKNGKDYAILPLPSPNNHLGTYSGGSVLAVSSRTRFPEKANKLIKYLTSESFITAFQDYSSAIPAFDSSFWQKRYHNKEISSLYNLTVNSSTYPSHPIWGSIENILSESLSQIFWELFNFDDEKQRYGKEKIIEMLKDTDKRIKRLLKFAGYKKF